MAMITWNRKDILPLTLNVLKITYDNYMCNIFSYLLKAHYPDLDGVVATDIVDGYSIELLNTVTTGPVQTVAKSLLEIMDTSESLANLYGINFDDIGDDERLFNLAVEFYFEIVMMDFPDDACEEKFTLANYENFLLAYSASVVAIVSYLCTMIADGQIDADLVWGNNPFYFEFLETDYSQHESFISLELLQALGEVLNTHYLEIALVE